MKWQRARNVSGSPGFLFWVETGRPAVIEGINEFDQHDKVTHAPSYRTNLIGTDGEQLYAEATTVELMAFFAVDVPLVEIRGALVAQGFTEEGKR